MPTQRADARRNYARILAVAEEEVAAHGANASLEQIARTAGVGSATVRRHFPSRRALLEAVFHERIEVLCARALGLADTADTRAALLEWLGALTVYAASTQGLAAALTPEGAPGLDQADVNACSAKLSEAGRPLLRRAAKDGAVTPGMTIEDLIALVTGIVLATERHPDPVTEANRLLGLAIAGVSPQRTCGHPSPGPHADD